jgi:hypothetical protein
MAGEGLEQLEHALVVDPPDDPVRAYDTSVGMP